MHDRDAVRAADVVRQGQEPLDDEAHIGIDAE